MRKRLIGIGMACLDQLVLWRDVRAPLSENAVLDYTVQGGGMAATAMVAVARLGGRAELWAAVGADWMGDAIVCELAQEGVDVSRVRRVTGARGPMVAVAVDGGTGERRFAYSTGHVDAGRPVCAADRVAEAGCVLVDGTLPGTTLPAARAARRLGVPVVGDVERLTDETRALLGEVDYAIVGEELARDLAGDDLAGACERLHALGPGRVVITLGARGGVYSDGRGLSRYEAFAVEVVDTTGAGDVFHGAFCYGLVEGFAPGDALRFASAAAAMKCRRLGGRAGIPGRGEVEGVLRERGQGGASTLNIER